MQNPQKIKKADIIVGIPSFNEADNIGYVTKIVDDGLSKYFKNRLTAIINVDNDSPDGTKDHFLMQKTKSPKVYISTPRGVRGKGNNFYNLFKAVKKFGAKVIIVVDADLKSITPEWIKLFAEPIIKGYDYATPIYSRNEYDGTITNNITFPLIYGLLGKDIRQPIGGDFAFSNKMAEHWLKQKWHETTKQYGIDIFMTMNAIFGGFKIAQVGLGTKIHKPSAPKLGPMFSQVVGTLLDNLVMNKGYWFRVKSVEKEKMFGRQKLEKPQALSVDYKAMKNTALYEFSINKEVLKKGLTWENYKKISEMYRRKDIRINADLWSKIIYDVIYTYDNTDLDRYLVEGLKPLYFGRVISYYKETMECDYPKCESAYIKQAKTFFKNREYLFAKYEKNGGLRKLLKLKKAGSKKKIVTKTKKKVQKAKKKAVKKRK